MKDISVDKASATSPETTEEETERRVDETLDLRGVGCPMNFVKVKLKLEQMDEGQNLNAIVDTGEPMRSIPRAIKEEGHKIIHAEKLGADGFSLLIRKGA